jgi:hypothetical protein
MKRKKYIVTRGFEHPGTGHWLEPGTLVEMSARQSDILVLSGHLKSGETTNVASPVLMKKRKTEQ